MKEIKIPELAESIMEGTIAEWLVKEGDMVNKGDPVVELETDKVSIEVQSDYTGVLVDIVCDVGEDVVVGDVIAKLDENAEAGDVVEQPTEQETEPKEEARVEE